MKVLMISGDANMLKEGTAAHKRYLLQAGQVEKLSVLSRNLGESKFYAAQRMIREGSKEKWDVVTAQDPFWLGIIAQRIAKNTGSKLQIQVHTDLLAQPLWKKIMSGFVLRRANSVRVVSERIKKSLEPMKLQAPITVLPVFIDKDAIVSAIPSEIKKAFPQFEKIILIVSRLESEKNITLAIKSMPEILSSVPKAGLFIAGEGSQFEPLQKLVKKLKLEQAVIFLGQRADVFSLYKSADLLLSTSYYEGFGAAIVEALLAGCPVVSTDVGVAREAGAIIASKKRDVAKKVVESLAAGTRGGLRLALPPPFEWAQSWRDTLTS